jgi:uncharacterized lipoprotein YehR (DUF1307 family)
MCFTRLGHIKIEEDRPKMKLKILDLSIQESYFTGHCELDGKEYSVNIQNHNGKIIKFPFKYNEDKVLISISGNSINIQDELNYNGTSEWIEIYSDTITDYLVNHQQKLDWLEIFLTK